MSRFRVNRRAALRGLGATIALPVLEAMLDKHGLLWGTANAAPAQVPIRMFLMSFACGTNMGRQGGDSTVDLWTPSGSGSNYTLSPALQSLAPVRGDVNVIAGLENTATRKQYVSSGVNPGCNHMLGAGTLFTGAAPNGQWDVGGPSVDQVAVTKLGLDTATRYPVVGASQPYGGGDQTPNYTISWKGPGAPIKPYSDPKKLFQALFGSATASNGSAADDRSVLDFVAADVGRLKARLGTVDQATLDQHLASIRGAEQAMSSAAGSCTAPQAPNPTYTDKQNQAYDLRTPTLIQLLVLALQCDITRVVTLSLGPAGDHGTYTWLGQTEEHHQLSHQPGLHNDQILAYTDWNVKQFVNVVQSLKAVADGSTTLLKNSVVFMSSEVADGDLHNFDNLPVLMAGNAGGRIATGRYVNLPYDSASKTGTPLNSMYVTMLQSMGANVTSFGVDGAVLPGFLA